MAARLFDAQLWHAQIKDVNDVILNLFEFLEDEEVVEWWVDSMRAEDDYYGEELTDPEEAAPVLNYDLPVVAPPETDDELDPTNNDVIANVNQSAKIDNAPPKELRRLFEPRLRIMRRDEEFYHHKRFTITASKAIILRQWIVLNCTYVELILRDFTEVAFLAHPYKMRDFVGDGPTRKGLVQIKTILESDTRDAILVELAIQAASNALKGSIREQLRHLERIVGSRELPKDLKDSLVSAVDLRNRIVHENYQLPYEGYWLPLPLADTTELLIWLCHIAAHANIPVGLPSEGY